MLRLNMHACCKYTQKTHLYVCVGMYMDLHMQKYLMDMSMVVFEI